MASSYPQFGLNYPLANNPQMMPGGNLNCMQPGQHTANCDPSHARPFASDPQTGQSICICQYHSIVNTAYRQYMHFSPPAGVPPPSVEQQHGPLVTGNGGAFSPTGSSSGGLSLPGSHPGDPIQAMYATHGPMRDAGVFGDFKDMSPESAAAAWRAAAVGMSMGMPQQNPAMPGAGCYGPYDPSLGPAGVYSSNPYCTNGYAMDPTGMNRRKNATRETTSQLKHWLYEHRKNPYPTKGEKIMLAIVTKMTLTQVSTWFANARRRLKKENKMTWSPRNRGCEDDDKSDTDEQMTGHDQDLDLDKNDDQDSMSELSSLTDENKHQRNLSISPPLTRDLKEPSHLQSLSSLQPTNPSDSVNKSLPTTMPPKPRIWSLADVAMDRTTTATQPPTDISATSPLRSHMPPHYPGLFPVPHPAQPPSMRGAVAPPVGLNFFPAYHHPAASVPPHAGVPVNLFTSNPNSAFSTPIHPSSALQPNRFSSLVAASKVTTTDGPGQVIKKEQDGDLTSGSRSVTHADSSDKSLSTKIPSPKESSTLKKSHPGNEKRQKVAGKVDESDERCKSSFEPTKKCPTSPSVAPGSV